MLSNGSRHLPNSVQVTNAMLTLKRTKDATICGAKNVTMSFAGYASQTIKTTSIPEAMDSSVNKKTLKKLKIFR